MSETKLEKTSDLIKKELGIEKGSGTPHLVKSGNLGIEQVIKIANIKKDSMLVNSIKAAVKSISGSCGPLGVLVEGKEPAEISLDIERGEYDHEIKEGKTEISEDKKKKLSEDLARINLELAKEKAALEKEEAEAKPVTTEAVLTTATPKEAEEKKEEKKEEKDKKEFKK